MNWIENNGLLIWCLVSTLITVIHTLDEVDGRIWEFLNVSQKEYYTFQALVFVLGFFIAVDPSFATLLVLIRVLDAIGTHYWFGAPGWRTAIWLLLDAAVILVLMG